MPDFEFDNMPAEVMDFLERTKSIVKKRYNPFTVRAILTVLNSFEEPFNIISQKWEEKYAIRKKAIR